MTGSLVFYGILGVVSTVFAFVVNRGLFVRGGAGRVSVLEGLYYVVACISLGLGWYFNIRYTHQYGHRATYVGYTKELFANWADDSAAQDYIIVNVVLLPLWTIVDGRRRGLRAPWIFFVLSLFTSLAFSMAFYLAFVERQLRVNATDAVDGASTGAGAGPSGDAVTAGVPATTADAATAVDGATPYTSAPPNATT
jgi:drug/metabolite transporter (DMT)-like permease